MREFVNNFQTVTKQVPGAAQEEFDIQIKDYNTITIFNNTTSNLISWDNAENYLQPQSFFVINGDTDQFLHGILKIILFEQVLGFPEPKCVLIKKRYINAAV